MLRHQCAGRIALRRHPALLAFLLGAAVVPLGLTGCQKALNQDAAAGAARDGGDKVEILSGSVDKARLAAAAALTRLDGQPVALAGVTFRPPSIWQDLGPSGMRQANYAFGPAAGDAERAACAVFYFGPGGGGDVRANIDRWLGQMSSPEGGSVADQSRESQLRIDGLAIHVVEVSGTYNAGMGGGMTTAGPQAGYHMLAAVLEAPQGNLFFKLTGPEATAREMGEALLALLQGVRRSG